MTALPLNSVVGVVHPSDENKLFVKGYALPGPRGNVKRVEISLDDGDTWQDTNITYQEGSWSWTIWEAEVDCNASSGTVYSRAIDVEGNIQPRQGVWNMRGVAYNGWGVREW